uniref:AlNc14C85G5480 protein n=1 Tax=Albugo laibachii Nc14 TaxID=890382 RepID=F0WFU5_9STRA|nr:AlNc14C85G5480 [Albugo laibachii Nc14]|eukprot:CCA20079.1 AlNc14C85G5480 [Albugo laibachii Nc14]
MSTIRKADRKYSHFQNSRLLALEDLLVACRIQRRIRTNLARAEIEYDCIQTWSVRFQAGYDTAKESYASVAMLRKKVPPNPLKDAKACLAHFERMESLMAAEDEDLDAIGRSQDFRSDHP